MSSIPVLPDTRARPSARARPFSAVPLAVLLAAFLAALLTASARAEEVRTGDPELDAIFSAFVAAGRGDGRRDALDALARSGREDARALLEAVLGGEIMLHEATGELVRVAGRGREVEMFGLLDGAPRGTERKRKLDRLRLDNRLRGWLRDRIASLGLESEDPVARLAAVTALIDSPEAIARGALDERLESEEDTAVLAALRAVRARQLVASVDPVERREGIAALAADLSPDSRRAIARIANAEDNDDYDEETRALAREAMARQLAAVDRYALAETVFFGLSAGSVLVLAAIGLAITFGVMGVINMAHGELIMLGAYSAWAMQRILPDSLALALLLSIPVAFLFTALVGVAIERGVIRFLYGRPLETLLATFGISLILQQLVRTLVSPRNVAVANPEFMRGALEINAVFSLTLNRLWILGFCLGVFALLLLVLRRTRFGLEMRAVAQNRAMARAMGVRSARVDALTFGLGAGVAGLAGVALSQLTNVGPNLGQAYIVDSFMVVVFGGVGNLWGTLVGGMTLGVVNKLMEPWAGAILAKILVLVFLILFIQRRPRGLFPERGRAAEGT